MQMTRVVIDSVRKPEEQSFLVVVLKEIDKERYLGAPVSKNHGEFLMLSLENTGQIKDGPRQMYEFVNELLDFGHLKIDRVIISDIKDGYYLAKIVVTAPSRFYNKQKVLDCYSADALIVAVQTEAPIFVVKILMEKHGLSRAEDLNKS